MSQTSLALLLWNYFSWSIQHYSIYLNETLEKTCWWPTRFLQKKIIQLYQFKNFNISLRETNVNHLFLPTLTLLLKNVRKRVSGPKVHPALDAKWWNCIPCLRLKSLKTTQNSTVSDSMFKAFLGVFFSFSGKWVKYAGAREGHVPRHSLCECIIFHFGNCA